MVFAIDDVVWASWRFMAEEEIPSLRHTNGVIGLYVTAVAFLHLYSYLDRLKQRALYCDTDSIMFVQPRDDPAPVEPGDNLGAMILLAVGQKSLQDSSYRDRRAKDGL